MSMNIIYKNILFDNNASDVEKPFYKNILPGIPFPI